MKYGPGLDVGIFFWSEENWTFHMTEIVAFFLIVLGNIDVKSFCEIFAGTILLDSDIFVLKIWNLDQD